MNTRGCSAIITTYLLWKLPILTATIWFSLLLFEASFLDFGLILENSAHLLAGYFPDFVMSHPGLKYFCQLLVIFIHIYAVMFSFLADFIGVPIFVCSYLITQEFLFRLQIEGNTLTADEFLRLYESFKEVQREKNIYFSWWTFMIYIISTTFYSLHARECVDSLGLTGEDVDFFTRFSMLMFIIDLIVLYKVPADVCISCNKITKLLKDYPSNMWWIGKLSSRTELNLSDNYSY
ncbi:unnamed protein product [Allacma fusca]|uniref:Uncharacterized protein n=1 Tax=Allacma fusca TaxID=39272 RepID=A0A8J2PD60_9HEXA|nr:unnamed protein product [Allacma fusca]